MKQLLSIEYVSGLYHVMSRDNARKWIAHDDTDDRSRYNWVGRCEGRAQ